MIGASIFLPILVKQSRNGYYMVSYLLPCNSNIAQYINLFNLLDLRIFFISEKRKWILSWLLMKTVLIQRQLFTWNHFRKGLLITSPLLVIVKEKFNSKIFLISKSILSAWGKRVISN